MIQKGTDILNTPYDRIVAELTDGVVHMIQKGTDILNTPYDRIVARDHDAE
jgi:hypothetical protein